MYKVNNNMVYIFLKLKRIIYIVMVANIKDLLLTSYVREGCNERIHAVGVRKNSLPTFPDSVDVKNCLAEFHEPE